MISGFIRGVHSPVVGLRLIAAHPRALLPFIPIPLILSTLYLIVFWIFWDHFDNHVFAALGASTEGWWRTVLSAFSYFIFAIFSWFSFSIIGMALASPFNETLALKVMKLKGLSTDVNTINLSLIQSLMDSSKLALVKLACSLLALLFPPLLLPLAILFVCIDHFDYVWSHQTKGIRGRLACFKRDGPEAIGFGALFIMVYSIPFLGLLLMPLAVISSTCLVCDKIQK